MTATNWYQQMADQKSLFVNEGIDGPRVLLCPRCGRRCRVATDGNQQARPLRKDLTGKGMCANCVVTEILSDEPFTGLLPEGVKMTDALQLDHIQEQFGRICVVGGAAEAIEEIDWLEVIANWDLPLPKKRGRRK